MARSVFFARSKVGTWTCVLLAIYASLIGLMFALRPLNEILVPPFVEWILGWVGMLMGGVLVMLSFPLALLIFFLPPGIDPAYGVIAYCILLGANCFLLSWAADELGKFLFPREIPPTASAETPQSPPALSNQPTVI